jgi:SSS family solute:Na+ symporter
VHLIDWIFVLLPLLIVLAAGLYTQRQVRSVADFVAANRSAGRYLICIGGNEMLTGAVVFVGAFEIFSHGGFAYTWWAPFGSLVSILLLITGFVSYRYRETRAMTLAQFFEIRYNKSFRLFAGLLGFFAGLLNFGIMPAIGARTMVYFFGLPESVSIFSHVLPTYVPLMGFFLTVTAFVALSGGVITIMIINTLEGILSQLFYLVIIFTVLSMFSWRQMHEVLLNRPPRHSLVNPFDTAGVQDFNIWNILMGLGTAIIATNISWQNCGAFKTAALTPHEGRMAAVLGSWQSLGKVAVVTLLALASLTYLHHPDFAAGAAQVQAAVHQISNRQAQEEMQIPVALAYLLPAGVKGLLCAILLMGIFGGDATHLHSWGSIFIQDVLVPLRKKPFAPATHLLLLRAAILSVACFAFFFGVFFHLTDYVNMWWSATMSIFTGGAGSAIIGGLYWKRGTSAGAWASFITGSTLAVGGIIAQQVFASEGRTFPLNGVQIGFFSSLAAFAVYIVTSLLTHREDFNLDRMLHRGAYARVADGHAPFPPERRKPRWTLLLGFDQNFTRGDKWIAGAVLGWSLFWFGVFLVVTTWNLIAPWQTESWARYYHVTGIGIPIFFSVVIGIWFTWGGLRDMASFSLRLRNQRVNALDDGTVRHHHNADEPAGPADIQ